MEAALRILLPHSRPIPVPAAPAGAGGPRRATVFVAGGSHALGATVGAWNLGRGATVVVLGSEATTAARAALVGAIAHAVAGGGPLVLVHTGAGGASLLHTLAREHPAMACVALHTAETPRALETARALARAPGPGSWEVTVDAAGHASVPAWAEGRWPEVEAPLKPGDRVVISGGTGGLGSALALHLALRLGLHPVLVDSARAGPRIAAALAPLQAAAVAFTHAVVDVTDAAALGSALGQGGSDAAITAVVHCAGVITAGPVATLDVARVQRVSAPKVEGLRALLSVLDRRRLRVVLSFGSVLSHLPHPHVGAYAYANELLRREVQRAQGYAPGPRYLTAEWSVWDGAGMAHASGATAQARRAGYAPISLAQGLRAVERLLAWSGPSTHALIGASFPGLQPRPG